MQMQKTTDKSNFPMDYNIRSNTVRVVTESGTKIMSKTEAVELAKSMNMNLIEVAYNKSISPSSICKIIDYAKFKYEQKKKQKEQAKKLRASVADVKEMSFTIRIDDGDKATKLKHIKEFLADGDKVKLSVVLTRREMDRKQFAINLMRDLLNELTGLAELDGKVTAEGRIMSCVVKPIKK